MRKIFNYRKFNNEVQDNLVEAFVALTYAQMDGKSNTAEYKEANEKFNLDFMKECCGAIPNYNVENFSLEDIKNPQIHNSIFFQERFNTLLAGMITPILPAVTDDSYANFYETIQCGWGKFAPHVE